MKSASEFKVYVNVFKVILDVSKVNVRCIKCVYACARVCTASEKECKVYIRTSAVAFLRVYAGVRAMLGR